MKSIVGCAEIGFESREEMIEVPVTVGFDQKRPIGTLRVEASALPPTPNFVFALAYRALEYKGERGVIPTDEYVGPYRLETVSIVNDGAYIAYLRQVGKIPSAGDERRHIVCVCPDCAVRHHASERLVSAARNLTSIALGQVSGPQDVIEALRNGQAVLAAAVDATEKAGA